MYTKTSNRYNLHISTHLSFPPLQLSLFFFDDTSSFCTYLMQKMNFFTTDFLIFCNWALGCNQYPINLYHNNYTVLSILFNACHPIFSSLILVYQCLLLLYSVAFSVLSPSTQFQKKIIFQTLIMTYMLRLL